MSNTLNCCMKTPPSFTTIEMAAATYIKCAQSKNKLRKKGSKLKCERDVSLLKIENGFFLDENFIF